MNKDTLLYILLFILVLILGLGGFWHFHLTQKIEKAEETSRINAAQYATTLASTSAEKLVLESTIADLTQNLQSLTEDRDDLKEELGEEQDKVESIEKDVGSALKTVGTLQKLSRIDPELLQKYSKVFFLNEHYSPPNTTAIAKAYLYTETSPKYIHAQAMPFFKDMVEDALTDGVKLYVVSGYRSFSEQKSLKSAYKVTYGSGANAFSADQGYSEHQLGTTLDFTTTGLGGGLDGFDATAAYTWLTENAYKYGFVLSYPKNNQYYIFEPWHWRFVGTDLARDLHKDNAYFYDLDQRKIDEYLVSIFD